MKIFISHSQKDEKIARMLKQILEKENDIDEAFIFEEKKRYGIQIDRKITDEIDESDYLVAIITIHSKESASVNQELGYAQGKGLQKIPMMEKGSEKGFLVYGSENIEFTLENFKNKCVEICRYIIKNGPKNEVSKSDEENHHYKLELLFNLHGICHDVFWAIFQLHVQSNPNYKDKTDIDKILLELRQDYGHCKSQIDLINNNTYVPAPIRSRVNLFLQQGIKPISFPSIPPAFQLIENTFSNPLKDLLQNDYFQNDHNLEIKKNISDLLEYIPKIQDIKIQQEKQSDISELKQVIDKQEKSRQEHEKLICHTLIGKLEYLKLSLYERSKFEELILGKKQSHQKQIHIDTRTSNLLTELEQTKKENTSIIQVNTITLLESVLMYGKILNEEKRWDESKFLIFKETQKEINLTLSKLNSIHPYKITQPYFHNPDWI